jgi:hypothetical protein
MKMQKIVTVIGAALATMALVLSLAGPGRLEAVDTDAAAVLDIQRVIEQPTLDLEGLKVTLNTDKPKYAPGDEPVVRLEITNPTDTAVKTKLWLGMTSTSPASRMSRIMVLPEYVWSENCDLELEPGAKQTIELKTKHKIAEKQIISVTMSSHDQKAALAKLLTTQQPQQPAQIQIDAAVNK